RAASAPPRRSSPWTNSRAAARLAKWTIVGGPGAVASKASEMRGNAYERSLLDDSNRRLLEELQTDARLTIAELGRRINLSAPAVAERIQRLERAGVITGYRAEVDPKAIGFPIRVIVRIRPTTRQLHRIPELAREIPEVV